MDREFNKRMQEKLDELKNSKTPEPIRSDGAGALDLGPRNVMRDKENPDILVEREHLCFYKIKTYETILVRKLFSIGAIAQAI